MTSEPQHWRLHRSLLPVFLILLAGCMGLSAPDRPNMGPLGIGDQATYQFDEDSIIHIKITGQTDVLLPNRKTAEAITAHLIPGEQAEGTATQVAIDPSTHRVIHTKFVDDCDLGQLSCSETGQINWGNAGVPWIFGQTLQAAALGESGETVTIPVPGPQGAEVTASYETGYRDGSLFLEAVDHPDARAIASIGGPNISLVHHDSSPFPDDVTLQNTLPGLDERSFKLIDFDRGNGPTLTSSTVSFSGHPFWTTHADEPQPFNDRTPPLRDQDFPEGFPLAHAIEAAETDEEFQSYLDEHPEAVAVHGGFQSGGEDSVLPSDPTGQTKTERWLWRLIFSDLEADYGWEIQISRTSFFDGREEEIGIEGSDRTSIEHIGGLPEETESLEGRHVPFDDAIETIRRLGINQSETSLNWYALSPAGWYEDPRFSYRISYQPVMGDNPDNGGSVSSNDGIHLDSRTNLLEQAQLQPASTEDW